MKTTLMMAAMAAALAFTVPASAQSANDAPSNSCKSMMDQANAKLPSVAESRQKKDAQRQMDMARSSMSAQEETACIMHMKHALNDMS